MIALLLTHFATFVAGVIAGFGGLYLLAVALDPSARGDHLQKRRPGK